MVYVPLLVTDLPAFLASGLPEALGCDGFSVTIPHKEAALAACTAVDPVAASIGAVNTLVRLESGGWAGFNTDWAAAVDAIEEGLGGEGRLQGTTVLVVGAGGAGRALAFGAASRGATVLIANRSDERAAALAAEMGGSTRAVRWADLQAGAVSAVVVANTTSLGMAGANKDATPVPAAALCNFALAFDAVYTPLETRLLREAAEMGLQTARALRLRVHARCGEALTQARRRPAASQVSGLDMFVGQAEEQFRLFTGSSPPAALMRATLLRVLGIEPALALLQSTSGWWRGLGV